jgi:hypothetical protein
MQNNDLKNHLAYVSTNFCFSVKVIKILEILNLTITENLAIVENAEIKLNKVQGESRIIIKNKLNY